MEVYVELHAIHYNRSVWETFGKPEGYVKAPGWRLVGTLSKCRTDDAPDFEIVMAWLQEKMPGESGKSPLSITITVLIRGPGPA